jgi:glycosyltransferase involved in cell wall biosynthesis
LPVSKLIIQIPCFNEEASLPITFACLPKTVPGYDSIETLVLDDGSTDHTAAVARDLGVTHVLELPHRGLAQTFMTGVRYALAHGAHTVVNFDADNQYSADDIATITAPIVAGAAGVVIGERPLHSIERFSTLKRRLHLAGNAFLRWLTGTAVTDAASGFRALRHDVACLVDIRSTYTYTIEMLLEHSLAGVPITFVPVRVTSKELRPSRLIKSNAEYLFKASCIIVRTLARSRRCSGQVVRPRPEGRSTPSGIARVGRLDSLLAADEHEWTRMDTNGEATPVQL